MNIVYPNLIRQLSEIGVSLEELSDAIGLELHTLKEIVHGEQPLTLAVAVKICLFLNYFDAEYLFFQLDNNIYQLESQDNIGR